ncbi:MAG TPA: Rieske (2Fe-2S) protein [Fimbriimonadaceae bacterium]|nr:Rieske (2Fe-2S) protein [Fimbriimonadaceae bacterium]
METFNKERTCECCKGLGDPKTTDQPAPARRTILGVLVGLINVGIIGAIVGPVVRFVVAPMNNRASKGWVSVARLEDLPEGRATEIRYSMNVQDGYHKVNREYSVYLRRDGDKVICLDPACTHLGCRVDYQPDRDRFLCPCHGGVFDKDGLVVSGPPPKQLIRHAVKVEGGKVHINREV